jgi:H+-translocating NAD(P) transhydrogenase subunit alpha
MRRAFLLAIPLAMGVPALARAAGDAESGNGGSGLVTALYVFMLATFIGLGVITRVSRLLHTPLMSITNAISAIAIVGSVVIAGQDHPPLIRFMGAVALFASMTNIVSGFLITDRMLKMFKKR